MMGHCRSVGLPLALLNHLTRPLSLSGRACKELKNERGSRIVSSWDCYRVFVAVTASKKSFDCKRTCASLITVARCAPTTAGGARIPDRLSL